MFDTEDDDLDFAPAAGSKLSSLFGQEKTIENGNPSLVYIPPKKPKSIEQCNVTPQISSTSSPASAPKFSVVIADIVHSFKLDAGVYCDQRKVGVAVLGNVQSHVFQMILYRTTAAGKQDYIAVAKITEGFCFLVQPKFYCSFYDDTRNNWSLVFSCQDSCMHFSRQVGAAHFRAILGKAVVTQMIDPGDERLLKGEATHLTISQQYFDLNSISPYQPIEATIKVSLNPSQAKWSEGLISASPGSRWAIFIPVLTELPWASEVSQSPLVLEVIVEKWLNATSTQATERVGEKLTSGPEEGCVQFLAESLSNNVSSSKASLISRVARMGQATLPLKGTVHYNPSDSETEEENSSMNSASSSKTSPNVKPQLKPKFPRNRAAAVPTANSESEPTYIAKSAAPVSSTMWRPAAVMNSENKLVQYSPGEGQIIPMPSVSQYQLVTTASPVTSPSEPMTIFISEARMQNTEMRLNMNRIVDKIDSLSTKVDTLSSNATARPAIPNATLDATTLLCSVEKIIMDNKNLTAEVNEKSGKIEELNQRIFSLVDNNAKILDQNRVLLEEKQKTAEAGDAQTVLIQKQQIEALESENMALLKKIAHLESRLNVLEDSNSDLNRSKMSELSAKDDELSAKLSELSVKDSELIDLKNALSAKENELIATIRELKSFQSSAEHGDKRVKEAEEKCERCEADNTELKDLVTNLSVNISDLESTLSHMKSVHAEEKTAFENQKKTYEDIIAQLKTELATQAKTQLPEAVMRDNDFDSTVTDLKILMNKVYRKISQYFDGNAAVTGAIVRHIVAVVLKSEVTQYTEELLIKKNRSSVGKNVPIGLERAVSPAVKDPPVKSIVSTGNAVLNPGQERSKPDESAVSNDESLRPPFESHTLSNPTSSEAPSDGDVKSVPKVSGTEEVLSRNEFWRSEPPPVPKFDDEEDNDDWLNM